MKLLTPYPCNLPFLISQKWGENPEFYKTIGMKGHNGWDLAVPVGTPIYSTIDGTVFYAQVDGTEAKTIAINTLDLFDYNVGQVQFQTLYTHLSDIKVSVGQIVKKGQLIGLSGNTGRYTTGPHLHYGIHPVINNVSIEAGNGYNGAVDPVHHFDGTYPSNYVTTAVVAPVLPCAFTNFQEALKAFQLSEGLTPYPQVGPLTKKALNKYLTIKYTIKN